MNLHPIRSLPSLLSLLLLVPLLWGCKSEEEKAQDLRMEKLEAHYQEMLPTIEALEKGLMKLHELSPASIASDRNELNEDRKATLAELDNNYPHVTPKGSPWAKLGEPLEEEIMFLWLKPSRKNERVTGLFQYMKRVKDWEYLVDVYSRFYNEEWDSYYTKPSKYDSEEERQALVDAAHAALNQLAGTHYIIGAQPWLWATPILDGEGNFEGGELAVQLFLYNPDAEELVDIGHAWTDPPMMAFVYGNTPEDQARYLRNKLPDELANRIFSTLKNLRDE